MAEAIIMDGGKRGHFVKVCSDPACRVHHVCGAEDCALFLVLLVESCPAAKVATITIDSNKPVTNLFIAFSLRVELGRSLSCVLISGSGRTSLAIHSCLAATKPTQVSSRHAERNDKKPMSLFERRKGT